MNTPSSSKPMLSVFTIALLLLLAWLTYGVMGVVKGIQTKRWPTTVGTVSSTGVLRSTSRGSSVKYVPEISYSYTVEGVDYLSKRYSSTMARGSSQWAKGVVERYPANSQVTVHYSPKRPDKSVIQTGLQSDDYYMVTIPLFGFVVVSYVFVSQIRGKRNPPR